MRALWLALGVTAAVAAGCQVMNPAPQDVTLTATRGSADTIMITLFNRSSRDVGYNLCASALERRSGSNWVPVPTVPDRVCTMELRMLPPGQRASYRSVYVTPLQPGEYRVTTGVEVAGGWGAVQSNSFVAN